MAPPGTDETTVLVVEDQEPLAETYTRWLSPEYDVRIAATEAEALAALGPDVDVALLDRRLPDGSGDAVLSAIRERGDDIQVVMVTAVEPEGDIVEMDFDDYLTKPVSGDDLRMAVETMEVRQGYEEPAREHLALLSRKAALERSKTEAELERSEAYQRLRERIEELDSRIDGPFEGAWEPSTDGGE